MANNRSVGAACERLACEFIKEKGYLIRDINFIYKKIGEIDIIAEFNGYLIFIEVKYRRNISYGLPIEAVTLRKQKTIIKVAEMYLILENLNNVDCRFDVIEVYCINGKYTFNHVENAFEVR